MAKPSPSHILHEVEPVRNNCRRLAVPGGWLYCWNESEPVFVPTPSDGDARAMHYARVTMWPLDRPGWAECDGALVRTDGVRVSLHIDLVGDGVPRDEDGDQLHYCLRWLVQRPRATVQPGRVGYLTEVFPASGPYEVMSLVDGHWPMIPERA